MRPMNNAEEDRRLRATKSDFIGGSRNSQLIVHMLLGPEDTKRTLLRGGVSSLVAHSVYPIGTYWENKCVLVIPALLAARGCLGLVSLWLSFHSAGSSARRGLSLQVQESERSTRKNKMY